MKRSSSHLVEKGSGGLFTKKTKNSQGTQRDITKKIIEKEPVSILDNQHIIREIEKKEEKDDYCFVIRLDPGVKRTSIVYTKLIDLNEQREERSEKPLEITIRHDEAEPHLITIRGKDQNDLALFIAYLREKEYFSANTAEQFLSLLTEASLNNSLSY